MEHPRINSGRVDVINRHFMEKMRKEVLTFINSISIEFDRGQNSSLRVISGRQYEFICAAIINGYSEAMGGDMYGGAVPPATIKKFQERAELSIDGVSSNLERIKNLTPFAKKHIVEIYTTQINDMCGRAKSLVTEYGFPR